MKKRIYISVMCQFIVLKTMFALYSAVVVNEAMWPIGVLIEVLLPLIGGFGVCWNGMANVDGEKNLLIDF